MQRMQSLDSKPNQSVESVANEADTMGSSNDYENVESFQDDLFSLSTEDFSDLIPLTIRR